MLGGKMNDLPKILNYDSMSNEEKKAELALLSAALYSIAIQAGGKFQIKIEPCCKEPFNLFSNIELENNSLFLNLIAMPPGATKQ
jgi:hypothetical protein